MADQADSLRRLIQAPSPGLPDCRLEPPMIVVSGGRAGVGSTTVAVNLAAVLADGGERVLLIDGTQDGSKLGEFSGVSWGQLDHALSDALAGRCSFADAIVSSPAGFRLLADGDRCRFSEAQSRRVQQRLGAGLQSVASEFDLFVVDVGSGLGPWARRFWLQAQLILLVTTADSSSLVDAYAMIKRSVIDGIGPDVRVVVNQCDDDGVAADVHRRLSNASGRFLGRALPAMPSLPRIDADAQCAVRVWESPDTLFGHGILWLGRAVSEVLARCSAGSAAA